MRQAAALYEGRQQQEDGDSATGRALGQLSYAVIPSAVQASALWLSDLKLLMFYSLAGGRARASLFLPVVSFSGIERMFKDGTHRTTRP